jgi:hypothetical protein
VTGLTDVTLMKQFDSAPHPKQFSVSTIVAQPTDNRKTVERNHYGGPPLVL